VYIHNNTSVPSRQIGVITIFWPMTSNGRRNCHFESREKLTLSLQTTSHIPDSNREPQSLILRWAKERKCENRVQVQHYNANTRFRTNLVIPESIDDTHVLSLWRRTWYPVIGSGSSCSSLVITINTAPGTSSSGLRWQIRCCIWRREALMALCMNTINKSFGFGNSADSID
jgi:hypothetical protein